MPECGEFQFGDWEQKHPSHTPREGCNQQRLGVGRGRYLRGLAYSPWLRACDILHQLHWGVIRVMGF